MHRLRRFERQVIEQHQTIQRAFGASCHEPVAMMRGVRPFDLAAVEAVLATFKDGERKIAARFMGEYLARANLAQPDNCTERVQFPASFANFVARRDLSVGSQM